MVSKVSVELRGGVFRGELGSGCQGLLGGMESTSQTLKKGVPFSDQSMLGNGVLEPVFGT